VINLELPWNPVRLEQRIGRVDRIGQSRTVHAINLLAANTAESEILAGLLRRLDCIQASEIEIAASVINRAPPPPRRHPASGTGRTAHAGLSRRARQEVARLTSVRQLASQPLAAEDEQVAATRAPGRRFPTICFVRLRISSNAGRLVEDLLVPLALPADAGTTAHEHRRRSVRERAEQVMRVFGPSVQTTARDVASRRVKELDRLCGRWAQASLRRERHLMRAISPMMSPIYQAGLFDNRSSRARRDVQKQSSRAADECGRHTSFLTRDASIELVGDPQVVLVLLSC
jgi:hypothetical protein